MLGKAVSVEARERTQIMAETSDGFKIAEADLEFRGPGEFLGSKQSGLPGFHYYLVVFVLLSILLSSYLPSPYSK